MAARQAQNEIGLSVADLRAILKRRFWWLVVPSVAGFVLAVVVALVWPPVYRATSLLLIEPPVLPEDLVMSTIVTDAETRFGQIKLLILARDNLTEIIDKFGLYKDRSAPIEEKVEEMRNSISIEPLPPAIVDPRKPVEIESFQISFSGRDPKVVAQVANQLTREFLSQNLKERTSLAEGTREFIDAELVKTTEERERVALELMKYREEHAGELPENLAGNGRGLERLSLRYRDSLQGLEVSLSQIRAIRTQVDQLRASGSDETADPVARLKLLELQINRARAEGKTDRHPDIVIALAEMAQLEQLVSDSHESDTPLSGAEIQLHNEIRNHEVNASVLRTQLQRMEEQIADFEAKIARTPAHQTHVQELVERLISMTTALESLNEKRVAASMGEAVELVQLGEKFKVVESAFPPSQPTAPNRRLVVLAGTVLGIALGFGLLAVREFTDQSFHTVSDLQGTLALPVLGAVPLIHGPEDVAAARLRVRRWVVAGAVFAAVLLGGGLMFYLVDSLTNGTQAPRAALEILLGV